MDKIKFFLVFISLLTFSFGLEIEEYASCCTCEYSFPEVVFSRLH